MQNQLETQIKPNPTTTETFNQTKINEFQPEERQARPKLLKPEYVGCETEDDYKDLNAIIKKMPHLQSIKQNETLDIEAIGDSYSYIIRSNNDDDVHKSIKYGIWCSTPGNNEKLQQVWRTAQQEKKDIYLFFSVVKSGQFVGAAKMTSNVQDETFNYWWQNQKWRQHFTVEWLFVKDITYKNFGNLKNCKDDPVIRSKDGTEVDWTQTGKIMLKTFKDAPPQQTIFNDFEYMDHREKGLRDQRDHNYNMSSNYYQQRYYNNNYGYYNQQQAFNNMYYMPMQMQFNGYGYPMQQYNQQQFVPNQKFNNIYPPSAPPKYNNNYQYQQPTNQNQTKPQ